MFYSKLKFLILFGSGSFSKIELIYTNRKIKVGSNPMNDILMNDILT